MDIFKCTWNLEFGNVGFFGGRKTGEPVKNPRSKNENQQQTRPRPHWGKASALTTAPSHPIPLFIIIIIIIIAGHDFMYLQDF